MNSHDSNWTWVAHLIGPTDLKAIPPARARVLDQLVNDAVENAARSTGPMQHLAVLGDRGTGKTVLLHALAQRLEAEKFAGRVVILAEDMPQIQSPTAFLAHVLERLGEEGIDKEQSWDGLAAQIDKQFAPRKRGAKLLVLGVENFNELLKRAFTGQADQSRLRNWLDRPESRIMLVATSASGPIDAEPGEPLFGFVHSIKLEPLGPADAVMMFESRARPFKSQEEQILFETFARLTNGTVRDLMTVSASFSRYGAEGWRQAIAEILYVLEPVHTSQIRGLGLRASVCMHDLIVNGEPVSQTHLADRLGWPNQSAVAQPFKEMRQKDMLMEAPDPHSRAKLYSLHDRYLACAYRERVLGIGPENDILFWVVGGMARTLAARKPQSSDEARSALSIVREIGAKLEQDGRAEAFKAAAAAMEKQSSKDGVDAEALAFALVSEIGDADLLGDIVEAFKDTWKAGKGFADGLMRAAIAFHKRGRTEAALVDLVPEYQVVLRAFWPGN